jgi:hypothetical protein
MGVMQKVDTHGIDLQCVSKIFHQCGMRISRSTAGMLSNTLLHRYAQRAMSIVPSYPEYWPTR